MVYHDYDYTLDMTGSPDHSIMPRSLSHREAEVVSWLELERPPLVTVDMIAKHFGWPSSKVDDVLRALVRKRWLTRVARGRYEPLLADTGGVVLPNAWAALSAWNVPYYIGFASAAYELGLTTDRPGDVQAVSWIGAIRPQAWHAMPIELIRLRSFNLEGSKKTVLHGHLLHCATVEKVLIDAAALPGRVGDILGLARIVDRAMDHADWAATVELAAKTPRGGPAARRLSAVINLLGHIVPQELGRYAAERVTPTPLYLANSRLHGRRGALLKRWHVVVNIPPESLRKEVQR